MLRALLLAAGLGSRLRPLTNNWPKCLMPISGRPLLEYWLQTLFCNNVHDVLVNMHFHADKVMDFLDRDRFVGWVRSTYEKRLLGTAGTLRANADFFRGHTVMLIHADNWCQCDFGNFINYHIHQRPAHCLITMMTFDTNSPKNCGIVEMDNQNVVIAFHEKISNPPGNRANAAVYILQPEILDWLEENHEITDFSVGVLPAFVGRIATWHNAGIHRDIGTLSALRAAQNDCVPPFYWPECDEWQERFDVLPIFRAMMTNPLL